MLTRQVQLALYKGADPLIVDRLMNLHGQVRGLIDEQRAKATQPPMGTGAPMTDAGPAPGQMPAVPPPGPMGNPPPMQAMP